MKKRITAFALVLALLFGMVPAATSSAAKKVALSSKKLTVKVGKTKKLKLKNNKKKVSWKVTSGKKNITLKSKKKTSVTIVGKKKGGAKVQAKIGKKKYTCKVTVTGGTSSGSGNGNTPGTQVSANPEATASGQPSGTDSPGGDDPTQPTKNPGSNPGQPTQTPGNTDPTQPTQTPGNTDPTQPPQTPGQNIDLGSKTPFNVGSQKLALGITREQVYTIIGSATRTEQSPQGFDVIVYNPGGTYDGYTLIYLENDKVVSLCAIGTAGKVSYGDMVKTGDAASTVSAKAGWSGESWFSAKTEAKVKEGEGTYKYADKEQNAIVLAYVDFYRDEGNKVYCIQVYSDDKTFDQMTKPGECKYNDAILEATRLETTELLIAYRVSCGLSSSKYYRSLKSVDGLVTAAQSYLNSCPKGSDTEPALQTGTALKNAILKQSDVPMYFAQITMAGSSDSIGFANSTLELKVSSDYIIKLSYTDRTSAGKPYTYCYQYFGVAAADDGNGHSYMVIDFVDRWYNSDAKWYDDGSDDGFE